MSNSPKSSLEYNFQPHRAFSGRTASISPQVITAACSRDSSFHSPLMCLFISVTHGPECSPHSGSRSSLSSSPLSVLSPRANRMYQTCVSPICDFVYNYSLIAMLINSDYCQLRQQRADSMSTVLIWSSIVLTLLISLMTICPSSAFIGSALTWIALSNWLTTVFSPSVHSF